MANCNLMPDPAPVLFRFTQNFSLDYLPYLGYAVWGWWLSSKKLPGRTLWLAPLAYLLVTLLAARCNRWYSDYKGAADGWLFSYFSIPSFLQASAAFCFFLALRDRAFPHSGVIALFADATLGVYLIHPLMINVLERFGLAVTTSAPVLSLLGFFVLLAAVCFVFAMVARRIPLLRKIM
jgi:surface polysaccharide O-acyltransferase-like enzyme